jgi:hypothetical protein
MTTTLKTLSALAIATATLTATTLATTGMASAKLAFGHGPVIAGGFKGFPANGRPFLPPHHVYPPASSGGHLISCGLGRGCTITPPITPPGLRDPGFGRDGWHDHWRRFGFGFRFGYPNFYSGGYGPACDYEYKLRTVYVPGFGLERKLFRVCKAI